MRKFTSTIISLMIIITVSFSSVLLTSCTNNKSNELDKQATSMINAFIAKDITAIKALTHPDYIDSINDIDKLFEAMASDGIILKGSLNKLTSNIREYVAYDSKFAGKTTYSIYDATIGETAYVIKIRTLENKNGSGIIDVNVGVKKD